MGKEGVPIHEVSVVEGRVAYPKISEGSRKDVKGVNGYLGKAHSHDRGVILNAIRNRQ